MNRVYSMYKFKILGLFLMMLLKYCICILLLMRYEWGSKYLVKTQYSRKGFLFG